MIYWFLVTGARKRGATKRSPLGWRMFFSKSRNNSQNNLVKNRKASTPITINVSWKCVLKYLDVRVWYLCKYSSSFLESWNSIHFWCGTTGKECLHKKENNFNFGFYKSFLFITWWMCQDIYLVYCLSMYSWSSYEEGLRNKKHVYYFPT